MGNCHCWSVPASPPSVGLLLSPSRSCKSWAAALVTPFKAVAAVPGAARAAGLGPAPGGGRLRAHRSG